MAQPGPGAGRGDDASRLNPSTKTLSGSLQVKALKQTHRRIRTSMGAQPTELTCAHFQIYFRAQEFRNWSETPFE